MRVLVRGGQFNGKARFETWLFTIARNLVIDQRRKRTMNSLDELIDGVGDDDRAMTFEVAADDPTPFDACFEPGGPRKDCGGAAGTGYAAPRGAGAALSRGAVAGRDCQGDQAPLSTVKSRLYRGLAMIKPRLGDAAER